MGQPLQRLLSRSTRRLVRLTETPLVASFCRGRSPEHTVTCDLVGGVFLNRQAHVAHCSQSSRAFPWILSSTRLLVVGTAGAGSATGPTGGNNVEAEAPTGVLAWLRALGATGEYYARAPVESARVGLPRTRRQPRASARSPRVAWPTSGEALW